MKKIKEIGISSKVEKIFWKVLLQLTTMSEGSSFSLIASCSLTALCFSAQTLLIPDFFNI